MSVVMDEIVALASEAVLKLGCTPCTLSIGIGRSQFEATALMIEAQVYGKYDIQNDLEKEITSRVNAAGLWTIGFGRRTFCFGDIFESWFPGGPVVLELSPLDRIVALNQELLLLSYRGYEL